MTQTKITIQIINWEHFQHYKNRKPPWIKLYRELKDNKQWRSLSPEASKFLIDLWLLACDNGSSESGGDINKSIEDIAWCLRYDSNMIASLYQWMKELVDKEFITFDSIVPAECSQDATPETEKSRDREQSTEGEAPPKKKRNNFKPPTQEEVQAYADEKGLTIDAEKFCDYFISVGWTVGKSGKKMKDWKAAVRNWVRRQEKFTAEKSKSRSWERNEFNYSDGEELPND